MSNYSSSITRTVSDAIYKTFGWMSLGLALTATISYTLWQASYAYNIAAMRFAMIPLIIIQVLLAVALTSFYQKLSHAALITAFTAYAALTGVTLSPLFIVYELTSLIAVFAISSGMFALTAFYGYYTKKDLSSFGLFFIISLFGLMILQLVNMFIKSAAFDSVLAFFGVIIFAALTAFDMQKIKNILSDMAYDKETQDKMAVTGAFILYLDFINLFLYLLRLLGKQRRD